MEKKVEIYISQVDLDWQFLAEHERDPVWTEERVQRLILSQEAVDAVRVVRCRNCKHSREKTKHESEYLLEDILICTSVDADDDCWQPVCPDHFCSYGERK